MHLNLEYILTKAEAIYYQIISTSHLTNNIRRILGLQEVPEPSPTECENHDNSNGEENQAEATKSSISNGIHFQTDKEEVSFQTSIDLNFL